MLRPQLRRWAVLGLLLVASASLTALFLPPGNQTPAAPVILMTQPYRMPVAKVGLLDRIMPLGRSWAWLWQVRYALFGRVKTIDFDTTIIDFTGWDFSTLSNSLPATPDFAAANGLRLWRVKEADVRSLRGRFKANPDQLLSTSRVRTGDNIACEIFSGNSIAINGTQQPVGLRMDLLAGIHKQGTDLTAVFCFSEPETNSLVTSEAVPGIAAVSIHTNLEFGARVQLSKELSSIFVLAPPPAAPNQKQVGLLLTSNVLKPKR